MFKKISKTTKIRPKKNGRGCVDSAAVVDALVEAWDDLIAAIDSLPQEEQDAIKLHFNGLIDGEDDLGDCLFGTAEDFDSRVKFLDDEN